MSPLTEAGPAGKWPRHGHRHRRGLRQLLHRGWDWLTEPHPTPRPTAAAAPVLRLYVCVGKHCPGGRMVLDSLRAAAVDSGIPVDPCGCLDLCAQGPVVIALPADAKPPRRDQPAPAPLARYVQVTPDDAPGIIAALRSRQD